VVTLCTSAPLRRSETVQPASASSTGPAVSNTSSKSSSCHTWPLTTPVPGVPPMSIEALAFALCEAAFQVTTAVFVTRVPIASAPLMSARKRSTAVAPGASAPYVAPKSAVTVVPAKLVPAASPLSSAEPGTKLSCPATGTSRSSVMRTSVAATLATLRTTTRYSSCPPASAGPPATTTTCLVIWSCCPPPTTTTVGSGPVAGLPSPSVSRLGACALVTIAWLLMIVPTGVPVFTRRTNTTCALCPPLITPAPAPGSGGVRSEELTGRPAASGKPPASGTG